MLWTVFSSAFCVYRFAMDAWPYVDDMTDINNDVAAAVLLLRLLDVAHSDFPVNAARLLMIFLVLFIALVSAQASSDRIFLLIAVLNQFVGRTFAIA